MNKNNVLSSILILFMAYRCFIICFIFSLCTSTLSISSDVQGLASLQNGFSVLKDWSGDPCLPAPYTWDWTQCNEDTVPRVTALLLGGYGLSGLLPDFSSMDALQTIDLHNNSLRGPIPDFLGKLPNLKSLNIANNQFNGTIPASLSTKEGISLTLEGNSLQLPPPATTKRLQLRFGSAGGSGNDDDNDNGNGFNSNGSNRGVRNASKVRRIVRIAIPTSVVSAVGAVISCICCCRRRRK